MSDAAAAVGEGRSGRLPAWLRPGAAGSRERPGGTGGRLWRIETVALVLVGLFLAVATVYDLARQTATNHRLIADLRTWRHYTRHDYHNISVDQLTFGLASHKEILCGNTSPGPPGARTQICLAIWGPVVGGLRTVHGGWYLPPYHRDEPANRYGCFGPAGRGRCRR